MKFSENPLDGSCAVSCRLKYRRQNEWRDSKRLNAASHKRSVKTPVKHRVTFKRSFRFTV